MLSFLLISFETKSIKKMQIQNPKRGKNCFELRMTAGHKSFTLAADNENEMQDWLSKLQSVLNQNKIQEDTRSATLEREKSEFLLILSNF